MPKSGWLVTDLYTAETFYGLRNKDEVLEIIEFIAPDLSLTPSQRDSKEEMILELDMYEIEDIYTEPIVSDLLNIYIGYLGTVPGYPQTETEAA